MPRHDPPLQRPDRRLHSLKLRRQHNKARPGIDRQVHILVIRNDRQQLLDALAALWSSNAELGHMGAYGIDQLRG